MSETLEVWPVVDLAGDTNMPSNSDHFVVLEPSLADVSVKVDENTTAFSLSQSCLVDLLFAPIGGTNLVSTGFGLYKSIYRKVIWLILVLVRARLPKLHCVRGKVCQELKSFV